MKRFREDIIAALKGYFMGAANVVPGVSGGTIALITGIFKRIVDDLNSLLEADTWKTLLKGRFKNFWNKIDGRFLLALAFGVVASIFTLAKLATFTLENYPVETWAFFFGLIIVSAFVMFKGIKGWGIKEILFAIFGLGLGLLVCTLSPTETPDSWWFIFICGAIAICTMILPGISGSFVLVILSKYDYIMNAVADLEVGTLAIFAAGCVVGILAFSKFLHYLLDRYQKQTMIILLGFVLGSLVKVWPWANLEGSGFPHLGGAVLWCLIGAAIIVTIEYLGNNIGKKQNN